MSDVFKAFSASRDGGAPGNVAEPPAVATLLAAAATLGVARLDAEVLLAMLARCDRARLMAFPEDPVDPLTAALYQAGVARRAQGEPLAYITGVREFWSLPFTVGPDVLIPRPETELLVERCLTSLDDEPRRVADLGTGSGAIALALARERPSWQIVATDASADALAVAAANRSRFGLGQVTLRQGSWCDALEPPRFDAIVSNPPYVAPDDPALATLRFEPRRALVAAEDGYADLLAIIAGAREHLLPSGRLLLEHGATQAARVREALLACGYADVLTHADLAGLARVTTALWP